MGTSNGGATRRAFVIGAAASLVASSAGAVELGSWGNILRNQAKQRRVSDLSNDEIIRGLKTALSAGTSAAVSKVGRTDGYFKDSLIHIALPGFLKNAQSAMALVGQSHMLDDLELRLNRGAEAAAPFAKKIFVDAIKAMTITDAAGILRGGDTAATDYFEEKMTPPLTAAFHPVVERELKNAGLVISFNQFVSRYNKLPLTGRLGDDAQDELIDHGLEGALDGLFYYVGEQEKEIRHNPAQRTSDILRRVFA